jgi:glycosyltransferase involved in cell wall biosynthesis
LIGQEKIDLVQSHLLGANVYCSLAGLLTGKPVVATFHGVVDIGENERFRRLKFALINRGARCVTAVSGKLRRDIIDKTFIEEHKISVIHNGIETDRFQRPRSTAYRKIYGWDADDTVIGSLGNIRSAKGYDVLLQAAALLANDSHKYRFLIAGAGGNTLHEKLLVLRKNLGLERVVHFTGFNDDPAGFLSNLDLFLLPSTSEGFSIATIQAMSARLPVIVTRSGGPEEIVEHGKTGWVVAAGDPDAIASAISKLAADRGLCENLSRHAKDHVEKTFDLNSMLSEYRKIYDGLLAV